MTDLNRLAAIHIMGWRVSAIDYDYYVVDPDEPFKPVNHWIPTRNIEHAFQCLAKMEALNLYPVIVHAKVRWTCQLRNIMTQKTFNTAEASAPAEAIVLACLRATGVGNV